MTLIQAQVSPKNSHSVGTDFPACKPGPRHKTPYDGQWTALLSLSTFSFDQTSGWNEMFKKKKRDIIYPQYIFLNLLSCDFPINHVFTFLLLLLKTRRNVFPPSNWIYNHTVNKQAKILAKLNWINDEKKRSEYMI